MGSGKGLAILLSFYCYALMEGVSFFYVVRQVEDSWEICRVTIICLIRVFTI